MIRKVISGIMLTLLLTSGTLTFNIQPAMAIGTIYIRADGSVDPPTAPISTANNITFAFTGDINGYIVVERNDIVIDGEGHTVLGGEWHDPESYRGRGIDLSQRSNVTVKKLNIRKFQCGVFLKNSSNNIISRNNITENSYIGVEFACSFNFNNTICGNNITSNRRDGISFGESSNNTVSGNNISGNHQSGVFVTASSNFNSIVGNDIMSNDIGVDIDNSSNNTVSGNYVANSIIGVMLEDSYNCTVSENNIMNSAEGVIFYWGASGNRFFHNNFSASASQARGGSSANVWDEGFPSGGNYWSDYSTKYPSAQELDDSGIWDTPYVVNDINQDNYPLMEPWIPAVTASLDIDPGALNLRNEGKWITAYAQFPEGYDPADINASTILLNGTIAPVLDHKYGFIKNPLVDYNGDGILEYMLKFDGTAVQGLIYNQGFRNCEVALTVTGKLFDDTAFEGTYTVKVVADTPSKR